MNKIIDINKRFWDKVEKTDTCWNWIAYVRPDGHGDFYYKNKLVRAHRVSWEIHNGLIPKGLQINHKCANPRCVNPDHLYAGTHQDNMNDKIKDGTLCRGETRPAAKLTEENIRTIRWLSGLGIRIRDLVVIYGVSQSVVSNICLGKTWRHVCP